MSLAVVSGLTVYAMVTTVAATSLVALTMRMKGQSLEVSRELRDSRRRIVLSVEDERRRLERDLHDGAQQRLIALRIQLGLAAELVAQEPQASSRLLSELACEAQGALDELRDLAHGIYPQVLVEDGLEAALEALAIDVPVHTRLDLPGIARHDPEVEAAVYFTCMEALQNAVKHAGDDATVTIQLRERRGGLYFEVRDTGVGFDTRVQRDSGGIVNMRDRIGAAGGTIELLSRACRGTTVMGSIPLGHRRSGSIDIRRRGETL
ncbi:MAG: sensor histidine kinase [Solirubrobacteraceae bacterium]